MGTKNILTKTMNFEDWLTIGVQNNWIGPPICYTHDGLPTSADEDKQFDEGDDPCLHILRLYQDEVARLTIEHNHTPSIWRNHWTEKHQPEEDTQ